MDVAAYDASYHGGSEGDVVDEGGSQSRNPHHQDDGYGQALVLRNGLRGQRRRGTGKIRVYYHSHASGQPRI